MNKLRTTGELLPSEVTELMDPAHPRIFIWSSKTPDGRWQLTDKQRDILYDLAMCMPPWFSLLAHVKKMEQRGVHVIGTCKAVVQSIIHGAALNLELRGDVFGYPEEDIKWYRKELEKAAAYAKKIFGGIAHEWSI